MRSETFIAAASMMWFLVFAIITDMVFSVTSGKNAAIIMMFVILLNLLIVVVVMKLLARHITDEFDKRRRV